MKTVEVLARSVDEAIQEALAKLKTTKDQVEVTVLEEGNKGLFGLLGSKQAKVKVERKPTIEWKVIVSEQFIATLLNKMDISAQPRVTMVEDTIQVDIMGENLGILIGRRGQTLDSLQYLVNLAVNKEGGDWVRIVLDVEGYRNRREETLRALARRLASKVVATGRRVALEPMSAVERMIVHKELQDHQSVETHSEGKDPFRRIIITAKK